MDPKAGSSASRRAALISVNGGERTSSAALASARLFAFVEPAGRPVAAVTDAHGQPCVTLLDVSVGPQVAAAAGAVGLHLVVFMCRSPLSR